MISEIRYRVQLSIFDIYCRSINVHMLCRCRLLNINAHFFIQYSVIRISSLANLLVVRFVYACSSE